VVFAGDVLFRQCTSTGWTGSYEKWFQCLDLMIQLDPEVIVPGHGPLCGIEGAMEMKAYLQYVRDESKKRFDTGLPSLEAAKRIEFGPYGEWRAPARLYMNVERTYCAFRNEPPNAPWDTAGTPRRLLPGREGERNRSRILTPFKELKPPYTKRTTAMKFPMIHTDEQGETHFDVRDIQDRELAMGPPPNPTGQLSDFGPVTTMCVISFPAGTEAPPHNAPQPYICIVLSGEGEVVTSDGEARRFQPGAVLFCDDLTGKGHVTRALTDVTLAFINRAES
jgi:quercetin dioxygenase-like cupin family protein